MTIALIINIIYFQFNIIILEEGNIMAKTTKKAAKKKTTAKKAVKKTAKKTAKKTTKKTVKKEETKTVSKNVKYPDKYTSTTMVRYIAEKNNLPRNQAKEIVESVFDVINAGVIAGDRVPIGRFGKMYVKVRPARKARKGRNPITGQEITIPAKRATKVPKFTFSKAFKESALKAKVTVK